MMKNQIKRNWIKNEIPIFYFISQDKFIVFNLKANN